MPTAPPSGYRPSCATTTAIRGSRGETATSGSATVSRCEPRSAGTSWRATWDTLSTAGRAGGAARSPTGLLRGAGRSDAEAPVAVAATRTATSPARAAAPRRTRNTRWRTRPSRVTASGCPTQSGAGVERRGVLDLVEHRPRPGRPARDAPHGVQDVAIHRRPDVATREDAARLRRERVVDAGSDHDGGGEVGTGVAGRGDQLPGEPARAGARVGQAVGDAEDAVVGGQVGVDPQRVTAVGVDPAGGRP